MEDAISKAKVLIEALPYLQSFDGKILVIKLGGAALAGGGEVSDSIQDIVFLQQVGIRPVVVHGGGPHISEEIRKRGGQPKFIRGHRYTDAETMKIVEEILIAQVNVEIVNALNSSGGHAEGMHRHFHNPLMGRKKRLVGPGGEEIDLGLVGEIANVDIGGIMRVCAGGVIPVIAPIATGATGEPLNVNADSAAAAISGALKAEKVVFMSDTHGIRLDPADEKSLVSSLTEAQIKDLVARGVITGGMLPKVDACLEALNKGVRKAHIIDGRLPHSLLLEIFTDRGVGTMILN
jgi:acetylglutamate kinase